MSESADDGLDVLEYLGEGYRRMVQGSKWTVAFLNYALRFDESEFRQLERHLLTDETFVLLEGEATLVIGGGARRVRMAPLKLYNVKMGVWHHIFLTPGARVLIAENADTSKENTEYWAVE